MSTTTYLTARQARRLVTYDKDLNHIRRLLWELDKGCRYCGRDIRFPEHATLEHIVPMSKGGARKSLENLTVICGRCNMAKADCTPREWLERLETQAAVVRKLIELNGY